MTISCTQDLLLATHIIAGRGIMKRAPQLLKNATVSDLFVLIFKLG